MTEDDNQLAPVAQWVFAVANGLLVGAFSTKENSNIMQENNILFIEFENSQTQLANS